MYYHGILIGILLSMVVHSEGIWGLLEGLGTLLIVRCKDGCVDVYHRYIDKHRCCSNNFQLIMQLINQDIAHYRNS